jgi:hypothetical protein
MTFENGKFGNVTGTKTGVAQLKDLNPYETVQAETIANQAGITISGQGNTILQATRGDWIKVAGVATGSAKLINVRASSPAGGVIKVCTGSASGTAVAYIPVEAGGMQDIKAEVTGLSGTENLFFVFSDTINMDSWSLSEEDIAPPVTEPTTVPTEPTTIPTTAPTTEPTDPTEPTTSPVNPTEPTQTKPADPGLPQATKWGDIDENEKVEMADIVLLCQGVSAEDIDTVIDPQGKANADVLNDGTVDSADISVLASAMVNSQLSELPKVS